MTYSREASGEKASVAGRIGYVFIGMDSPFAITSRVDSPVAIHALSLLMAAASPAGGYPVASAIDGTDITGTPSAAVTSEPSGLIAALKPVPMLRDAIWVGVAVVASMEMAVPVSNTTSTSEPGCEMSASSTSI